MKMVNKILLGLAATAAVIAMVGCKFTDDSKKTISGTGNDKTINHENTTDENYRAYISTDLKHSGALVKITFEDPDKAGFSKMGVIFDLKENKDTAKSKSFYIIGVAPTAYSNFYVSKMENITDIQAYNFGAKTNAAAGQPKETEYVALNIGSSKNSSDITLPAKADDGSISLYIYYKALKEGKYEWAALKLTDEKAKNINLSTFKLSDLTTAEVLKKGEITNAFDAVNADDKVPQNKIAVYANVLKKKTLKGKWQFSKTYLEAEEIDY